ncbi:hypothetical protein [Cryobacterium aureum]|nr:hypothetical protein [Cryobacterium aureum]
MSAYTIPQLDRMITLATQLGFCDDVEHWKAVRAEMKRGDS